MLTCDEFIWITDGKAVLFGPLLSTNTHKHSKVCERIYYRRGSLAHKFFVVRVRVCLGRELTEGAHVPETDNLENSLGTVCERH